VSDKKYALTLGYNSDGNADKLAEVQASALQVSSFDLADVATNHDPQQYQVLAWSAVGDGTFLYAPSTITAGGGGGGGGVSFPTGSTGDILYYHANGTSVTSIDPTTTPLNLATTGYVQSELADYATNTALATTNTAVALNTLKITNERTDLSEGTATNTTVDVNSSDGDNATLAAASTSRAGLMTKAKFDEVVVNNGKVTNADHTGDVTGDAALTIANDVVTFAKFQNISSNTILGRNTALAGDAKALSTAEVRTLLNVPELGSTNTFTQANAFQNGLNVTGPVVFTGVASFTQTPTVAGADVVVDSDLNAYATNVNLAATGAVLATTNLAIVDIAAGGASTVYVLSADAGANEIYYRNNSNAVDGIATTAGSRTFLGTAANFGNLIDVDFESGSILGNESTIYYDGTNWVNTPGGSTFQAGNKSVSSVSGSFTVSNVVTVPPGFTGKGDTTVDSFIIFSGTDASSTEYVGTRWGANWVEGPQNIATTDGNYFAYVSATPTGDTPGSSGVAAVALNDNALEFIENGSATTATFAALTVNGTAPSSTITPTLAGHLTTKTYVDTVDAAIIAGSVLKAIPVTISAKHTATGGISFTTVAPESTVTPAAGNDLTNKTYVDSRTGAPITVLAIGSGTADVDGVEHDMHWKVPAISDASITFAATEGSSITFATAGTYQIDVAARLNGGSSGYNRLQGTLMTYKYNTGTSSWDKLTDHIADDYVTRDSTTGPMGSFNLNTMLELSAGDQVKFSVSADSLGSSANMMEAGTILRIVGWT